MKTHLPWGGLPQGVFWAGAALLAVPVLYHTRMVDHASAADVLEGEVHVFERGSENGSLGPDPGSAAAATQRGS